MNINIQFIAIPAFFFFAKWYITRYNRADNTKK